MKLYSQALLSRAKDNTGVGTLDKPTHESRVSNPICGDKIHWTLVISNQQIDEARYDTRGCILCKASASVLFDRLQKRRVDSVLKEISGFQNELRMLSKGEEEPNIALFSGLQQAPSRLSCVLLPWQGVEKALRQ